MTQTYNTPRDRQHSIDANLPVAFPVISIDPSPPSLRNGGYIEDRKGLDQSCMVSGIIDFCEQAHLVPAGSIHIRRKESIENTITVLVKLLAEFRHGHYSYEGA